MKTQLWQCHNAKVFLIEKNGIDEYRIVCIKGHKLGDKGDVAYWRAETGKPLEYCHDCPDIDWDAYVEREDRGWVL